MAGGGRNRGENVVTRPRVGARRRIHVAAGRRCAVRNRMGCRKGGYVLLLARALVARQALELILRLVGNLRVGARAAGSSGSGHGDCVCFIRWD